MKVGIRLESMIYAVLLWPNPSSDYIGTASRNHYKLALQFCPLAVLLTDQSSLRTKAEKGQIPHYLFSVT